MLGHEDPETQRMSTHVEYKKAQPSGLNKVGIAALASQLTQHTHYEVGGDLEAVVESLGGRVQFLDLYGVGDSSNSGSIKIDGFRDFSITLANHTGPLRDRFTIAHELGHYMLHYLYANQIQKKGLDKVIAERYGFGREETEANVFAACFLMPEDRYISEYKIHSGAHTLLSEIFGVSTRASKLRAKNLGLE